MAYIPGGRTVGDVAVAGNTISAEPANQTVDFIGNWSPGQNSFGADAPNAALVAESAQTGELYTAIIELFNPIYNMTMNTLRYTIMAENATPIEWPGEFGQTILIIDSPPCNPSPNDTNGVSLNDCGY